MWRILSAGGAQLLGERADAPRTRGATTPCEAQTAGGRGSGPGGRVDPRVVDAARRAISEQTDRSTGTVARLRRRVGQLLAECQHPPPMPPERTFYRLVARLSAGRHTFGSARTRRSLAKQPEGPFGTVTAARPGEWTEIDSTPLDVRVVLDDGTVDRVELTIACA
jgi:putative transposase